MAQSSNLNSAPAGWGNIRAIIGVALAGWALWAFAYNWAVGLVLLQHGVGTLVMMAHVHGAAIVAMLVAGVLLDPLYRRLRG